jgi:steroid delta-isomerase-like uncharacterized protein
MTTPHQTLLTLIHALNTHDPKGLPVVFAAHFRGFDCAQAGAITGPEGVWGTVQNYLRAFPDLHLQLIDAQLGEQGAAVYWTARGTHTGPWMNIPPTGREVSVQGMWMLHVEKGRITRARSVWDVAGLLRAIGLLPDL